MQVVSSKVLTVFSFLKIPEVHLVNAIKKRKRCFQPSDTLETSGVVFRRETYLNDPGVRTEIPYKVSLCF